MVFTNGSQKVDQIVAAQAEHRNVDVEWPNVKAKLPFDRLSVSIDKNQGSGGLLSIFLYMLPLPKNNSVEYKGARLRSFNHHEPYLATLCHLSNTRAQRSPTEH